MRLSVRILKWILACAMFCAASFITFHTVKYGVAFAMLAWGVVNIVLVAVSPSRK